jgi:Mn-dependent DtxR family transcriptional regulator
VTQDFASLISRPASSRDGYILSMTGRVRKRGLEGSRPRRPLERRSGEATEDYLETINALIEEKGFAASVDIAERMSVSKPTVTSIVKKLDKQGFLVHEKYRGLRLTPKGKKLALEMRSKHELLTKFLMLFGVDEARAREDAERIEHGLTPESIEKFRAFTQFALDNPSVVKQFEDYLRSAS